MDKFEIHDGVQYKVINSKEYVSAHRNQQKTAYKTANVVARRGYVGEIVETVMKNGLRETKNMVSYDPITGEPDWVLTQPNGELTVITDSKYRSLYNIANTKPGEELNPIPLNRPVLEVDENVCLVTSWGEMQYIKAGGVLVTLASNDIYGIQKEEYENTYKEVPDVDAKPIFDENISTVVDNNRPKIFLSVAYPYHNENNQKLLKEVVEYVNSKGILAINVRKINENNVNLVKEISTTLGKCEGVLSLAFNRNSNKTSPFIHIETALATSMNLASLMIVPNEVDKEGVLHNDNSDGNEVEINAELSLYDDENKEVLTYLNKFTEQVTKRYKLQINKKDIARFKTGLMNPETSDQTKNQVVDFLKAFYQIKDKDFQMKNVFIKRPTQIKAMVVDKSGFYETKDGIIELRKGDFLVLDQNSNVKPYAVKQEQFNLRYVKVNGTQDTYVTKFVPVLASRKGANVEICPLIDTTDIYEQDIKEFGTKYESLKDYILNLESVAESVNQNDLSAQ